MTVAKEVITKLRRIRRDLLESVKLLEDNAGDLYLISDHADELREYAEEIDIIIKTAI